MCTAQSVNSPFAIYSRDRKHVGKARRDDDLVCNVDECNGVQYVVSWEDGFETIVCGKGLEWLDERTAQIV